MTTLLSPSSSSTFEVYTPIHKRPQTADTADMSLITSPSFSTLSMSTQKSVAKLHAEVNKMKATKDFLIAEAEEKFMTQREAMVVQISEEHHNLERARMDINSVKEELKIKEEFIEDAQRRQEMHDAKLLKVEKENKEIEQMILVHKTEQAHQKEVMANLEAKMETILQSMTLMQDEHERISLSVESMKQRKQAETSRRISLLHAILEKEMELKKEAASISDMFGVKGELLNVMNHQSKMMQTTVDSLTYLAKST